MICHSENILENVYDYINMSLPILYIRYNVIALMKELRNVSRRFGFMK